MSRISSLMFALTGLVMAIPGVKAAPMNKCIVKGTVTYQQSLCPSDQIRIQPTIEELNAAEKKRRAAAAATATATATATVAPPEKVAPAPALVPSGFSCDGRQYCSQMKSCAEAKFFLANCAGAKMDGDKNGIPCEQQWCNP